MVNIVINNNNINNDGSNREKNIGKQKTHKNTKKTQKTRKTQTASNMYVRVQLLFVFIGGEYVP